MASPISPLEALQIVRQAVLLYKKMSGYPDEIAAVGRRIEDLEFYLSELLVLINDKQRHCLANLRPQQTQRLRSIISDIRTDANGVYEILTIWEAASKMERLAFSIGRNPKRLEELTSSMDQRKQDLRDILQLMGLFALQPHPPLQPVPPSAPTRSDYGVIFVDPHNRGRSKVAEGYIKLVWSWTIRTGGDWRVRLAHSAGTRLRDRGDCGDVLRGLPKPIIVDGGSRTPSDMAMASLFDNKYFDYSFKHDIEELMTKVSRNETLAKANLTGDRSRDLVASPRTCSRRTTSFLFSPVESTKLCCC